MNKTSVQTSLWLVWSLGLQDRHRWTFDEDQIIILIPPSAAARPKTASKQYTFTFLLPPDTLTPLSHPHHELYISCANGKGPILTWNVGASCLASAEPLTGPTLFLRNFATTKRWALFKDGANGEQSRGKQKGDEMRFLSENYWNQAKIKGDWRISSSANYYTVEQEVQQKNMRQKKTNTEGIWKKPHVALL